MSDDITKPNDNIAINDKVATDLVAAGFAKRILPALGTCYRLRVRHFKWKEENDTSYCIDKYRVIMYSSMLSDMRDKAENRVFRVSYANAIFCVAIVAPGNLLPQPTRKDESYLVIDAFATRQEAENLIAYLKTDFVYYLVSLYDFEKGLSGATFANVPVLEFGKKWDDAMLYDGYKLTPDEIALIQSVRRKCKMESE